MSTHQRGQLQQHLRFLGQGRRLLHPHHLKCNQGCPKYALFLHATPVAKQKHVIYLLLVLALQPFLFSNDPTRSSSIFCLSHSFYCSAFLRTLSLRLPLSTNGPQLRSSFSLLLTFLATFRAVASSSPTDFNLERSSSLLSMLWAIYTLIVSTTFNRLKSRTRCRIKLQTPTTI